MHGTFIWLTVWNCWKCPHANWKFMGRPESAKMDSGQRWIILKVGLYITQTKWLSAEKGHCMCRGAYILYALAICARRSAGFLRQRRYADIGDNFARMCYSKSWPWNPYRDYGRRKCLWKCSNCARCMYMSCVYTPVACTVHVALSTIMSDITESLNHTLHVTRPDFERAIKTAKSLSWTQK